jgi:hypothetical protein
METEQPGVGELMKNFGFRIFDFGLKRIARMAGTQSEIRNPTSEIKIQSAKVARDAQNRLIGVMKEREGMRKHRSKSCDGNFRGRGMAVAPCRLAKCACKECSR